MAAPTDVCAPLVLPPVDSERPGQFVLELLALAERHAHAAGTPAAAPDLLLAVAVAAAERHGQCLAMGARMITAGTLMRDRECRRRRAALGVVAEGGRP